MAISTDFKRSAYLQERDDIVIPLVTLSHPDLSNPIRVAYNHDNIVSRGETYIGTYFGINLPIDDPETAPRANLEIDNVDQAIVRAVRGITSPVSVTIEVIRTTAPDFLEVSYEGLEMKNVSYDAKTVTGDLTYESFLEEPYPQARFDPARFPGAF
tara:strand:+ start:43482 stop:43949 length:468 start_codon:yes stop_codon:yes gene_type:complete